MIGAALRALTLAVLVVGCDTKAGERAVAAGPRDFDDHDCAACGMIVRDQPSPRGQLIHRNGTRLYFCSIADLVVYHGTPSPHGAAVGVYVELTDPAVDPIPHDTTPRPWSDADQATYVTRIERPRIMGPPVLVYASTAQAERIASELGGQVRGWADLQHLSTTAEADEPPQQHSHGEGR